MKVRDVFGIASYAFTRYGVLPDDTVEEAARKLEKAGAKHLADLVRAVKTRELREKGQAFAETEAGGSA